MDKQYILSNVGSLSAEQIAQAVNDGVVTVFELRTQTSGAFGPTLKYSVEKIVAEMRAGTYGKAEEPEAAAVQPQAAEPSAQTVQYAEPQPTVTPGSVTPGHTAASQPTATTVADPFALSGNVPTVNPTVVSPRPVDSDPNPLTPGHHHQMFGGGQVQPQPQQTVEEDDDAETITASDIKSVYSFSGKIGRKSYATSLILCCVFCYAIVRGALYIVSERGIRPDGELIFLLILTLTMALMPVWYIIFSQGAKRCHDMGKSAWLQLIPFYALYMIGAPGTNQVKARQRA